MTTTTTDHHVTYCRDHDIFDCWFAHGPDARPVEVLDPDAYAQQVGTHCAQALAANLPRGE